MINRVLKEILSENLINSAESSENLPSETKSYKNGCTKYLKVRFKNKRKRNFHSVQQYLSSLRFCIYKQQLFFFFIM